jgi:hypothetical protein
LPLPAHCTCCIVTPDGFVIGAEPAAIPALLAELRKSPPRSSSTTAPRRRSQRSSSRADHPAGQHRSAQKASQRSAGQRQGNGQLVDHDDVFIEI